MLADPAVLYLPATMFAERGFSSVRIDTQGSVVVPDKVEVTQSPVGVELTGSRLSGSATGLRIDDVGRLRVLDLQYRLERDATLIKIDADKTIRIGADARLATDVGGSIELTSSATSGSPSIQIDGAIDAPAGSVRITAPSIVLGSAARVTATGVAAIYADPGKRLRTGQVLDGGSVILSGAMTLARSTVIDVSGAAGTIDNPARRRGVIAPLQLFSNGGTITLSGENGQGSRVDAVLSAHGGGGGASGGALTIDDSNSSGSGSSLYVYGAATDADIPGHSASFKVSDLVLSNGGFASISLVAKNGLELADGVSLNLPTTAVSVTAPTIFASTAGAIAQIRAAYISLYNGNGALAPVAPAAGKLLLEASLIDIGNAAIRGFAETELAAADIRFVGQQVNNDYRALLDVDGALVLRAAQVYPASTVTATVRAADRITVQQNGTAGLIYSAAGALVLEAPVIEQNGTLRVPFGSITLKATDRLILGAGSVTSASGAGLVVPYGNLRNGEEWIAPDAKLVNGVIASLAGPPEKKVVLDAPAIELKAGAVIDIRGGGDLHAWEAVPGPGGSHDVLAMPGVYAVVPASGPANAPNGVAVGSRIWLAGGGGLAEGWYTLLPAHYALLPGGYAVQVMAGTEGRAIASSTGMPDGTVLMAGRTGNALNGSSQSLSSIWRVMSGDVVRKYSEYNEASANAFFSSDAFKLTRYRLNGETIVTPRLPMDGGSVIFKATEQLILDGQLQAQAAAGGRGGLVDIAAARIAVVGAGHDTSGLAGYLILDADRLNTFGAASLLLGGVRSGVSQGLGVEVTADSVVVRNDENSALTGPELILAARDEVTVAAGSVLRAKGEIAGGTGDLIMKPNVPEQLNDNGTSWDPSDDYVIPARDWGALIRLSNGDAAKVVRSGVDTTVSYGTVDIGAGAVLAGGKALIIDATRNTIVASSAQVSGRSIALGGSRIGFGGGSEGLVFDVAALARFADAQNLTLRSYSTIDFYTGINFGAAGLGSVTLDAGALVGRTSGTVAVAGDTIVLQNSGGVFTEPGVATQGALTVTANELVLGEGDKVLRGFGSVALTGINAIIGDGHGSLNAGTAIVTLTTPVLTGRNAGNQSVITTGALTLASTGGASTLAAAASLGTIISLSGGSLTVGGRIDALGGGVNLTATNGDVKIIDGAVIDVGGLAVQFYDITEHADAGRIAVTALGGGVRLDGGAVLNLKAAAGGGNAGTLSAVATGGGVTLDGTIDAHAANGKGGSFVLDIVALPDFAGFSQRLENAGFTASRQFRIRSNDVVVDGTTKVDSFTLVADTGKVTVRGAIDARAAYGGGITIIGGNGLTMESSADLKAGATTDLGGGRVTLDAGEGRLDVQGGAIDVAGGEGGKVRFRARQVAGPDYVAVDALAAIITGARSKVLEGVKVYENITTVDAALRDAANVDADAFIGNTAAVTARLNGAGGVALMSGIEIRSAGDMTVTADWNLAGLSGHEGGLTLRAAGNLTVLGHISDGFSSADRSGALLDQASWDIRLVSGADFGSANPLAVRPIAALAAGSGSLIVGDTANGYQVRTGTGDLSIAVGRDLTLAQHESVIYTAGRMDTTTFPDFVQLASQTPVYGVGGGNLSIAAQGTVKAVIPYGQGQLFTSWLKRQGDAGATGEFAPWFDWDVTFTGGDGQQSAWWVDYSGFQHGVGALGGGNVNLSSGRDLVDLTVVMPTSARVRGGRTIDEAKILELRNGGALTVNAGGSIRGGQYYIGRGAATLTAAELTTGRTLEVTVQEYSLPYSLSLPLAPVLAIGDATMTVKTAGNLQVQTVADPLLMPLPGVDELFGLGSYMSGYTGRTALTLTSVGGDVLLGGQTRHLSRSFDDVSDPSWPSMTSPKAGAGGGLYPAATRVTALSGSVVNRGLIRTMPNPDAEFRMLAERDVLPGTILMARNKPASFPTPFQPHQGYGLNMSFMIVGLADEWGTVIDNPEQLVLKNDFEPSRIYALKGSVIDGDITANEQLWIRAGQNLQGNTLKLRNLHPSDVSWLDAGRDIVTGTIDMVLVSRKGTVIVEGPGTLLLTAGRDVFGQEVALIAAGNRDYFYLITEEPIGDPIKGLPTTSASIEVIAGLNGKQPDYAAFGAAYLDPSNVAGMPGHLKATAGGELLPIYLLDDYKVVGDGIEKQARFGLVSFVRTMTGETLSPLDAWARFLTLPEMTRQVFLRQVYMQELREAGRDQIAGAVTGGYNRGYSAVKTLFPGEDWRGDVLAGRAILRTMTGGDIRVMTPGGGFQVAGLGTEVGSGYGLVTLGSGRIEIFARNDVIVNRSRILTFSGGDEIIWSTLGDIDAGRGAKTARLPLAPDIVTDQDGVTRILERPNITGSGIGTIIGYAGVEPGDVDLIAPEGTVNAGDAGIRVSGDLSVSARFVLNVGNIEVAGAVKGLPKQSESVANLAVETKDKSAADAVKEATQTAPSERPSIIIVEVLGYGGGDDGKPQRLEDEERRRPAGSQTYLPNSLIQLVGNGPLTDAQKRALTEEEQRNALSTVKRARSNIGRCGESWSCGHAVARGALSAFFLAASTATISAMMVQNM